MGTWTINPDDLAATRTGLGLGTASVVNTGTTNGNVPIVGSDGKLAGAVLPPSGGSIDLTTSGAVTAGKTLILNANGTVSEGAVSGISQILGSSFTPTNETASGDGRIVYMTTPDRFLLANTSTISSSNIARARVLDLSSSMAITETTVGNIPSSANIIFGADYSATHDRVVIHQQNTSPHGVGVYTISYSSANGLDIDAITNAHTSNLPYGSSRFIGASDHAILTLFASVTTPATVYGKFFTLTTGSDASGDSLSGGSDFDVGITSGGGTYHYHHTPVWFSGPSKLLMIKSEYHSATDYRTRLTHGTISGTGSSTSYSEDGEANWNDSDKFLDAGKLRYDSGLDRACWWDGKYLRTLSLTGGYAQSSLQTIQTNYPTYPGLGVGVIPGTNFICLFGGDNANSDRVSIWVVTITKGSDASGDSFSVASPVQISTDGMYYYADVAWSPDAGGFLLYTQGNGSGGASKSYGIRPDQSSTNVTASNFIGFAESSVGDGATVTVQLPGGTATPAQGSLTAGTTYYVNADGTIGTSDVGYGKAGRAVSSTKLIIEERT